MPIAIAWLCTSRLSQMMVRLGILCYLMLFSCWAFADNPQWELNAAKGMIEFGQQSEQICQALKKNPHCSTQLGLMQNALGLSVGACQAEKKRARCEEFIQKFPEYEHNQMECEPYQVCKLALTRSMANGCERYGIKIKDEFIHAFEEQKLCVKETCLNQDLLTLLQILPNPELFLAQLASKQVAQGIRASVTEFNDDRAKLPKVACLDPETRYQFACYLTVKYGGALLGATSTAREGAELMMKGMSKLDAAMIVSAEREVAITGSAQSAPAIPFSQFLATNSKIPISIAAEARAVTLRKAIEAEKFGGRISIESAVQEKIASVSSTRMRKLLELAHECLNNQQAWASYIENLYKDAAQKMNQSINPLDRASSARGMVNSGAIISVLKERAATRGEVVGVLKTTDKDRFFKTVQEGPFLDKAFDKDDLHGRLAHLLQRDFLTPSLEKNAPGATHEIYNFLGSPDGQPVWDIMFDNRYGNLNSPEYISRTLRRNGLKID